MPLPASCYTAPPSPWVWPGRGCAAATSMVRAFQPASLPAAPTGPHGPTGRFTGPFPGGPFPGGPSPVTPPTFPAPDPNMHSSTPCAFAEFFRVPRPLLSRPPEPLCHRPPQV